MNYCNKCGNLNNEKHNFCTKCGTKIVKQVEEETIVNDSQSKNSLNDKDSNNNEANEEIDIFIKYLVFPLFIIILLIYIVNNINTSFTKEHSTNISNSIQSNNNSIENNTNIQQNTNTSTNINSTTSKTDTNNPKNKFQYKDLEIGKENNINKFIEAIKIRDKYLIAEFIVYPLSLEIPIPSIKDKKEFIEKFNLVFDDYLLNEILIKREEWQKIGVEGIMFKNGDLWFDADGYKIIAINYKTKKQQDLKQLLINKEKDLIHQSLRNYSKPWFEVYTDKYRIRVDYLKNGKYRYASWNIDSSISDKPDIIMNNGTIEYNGNGGTYSLYFTNGEYKYVISDNQAFNIKSYLKVFKNDKLLLDSELRFD